MHNAINRHRVDVVERVKPMVNGFGTVAYSLSPAGAQKLLARVFPIKPFLYRLPRYNVENENLSFDCVLAALYDSLNACVCVPPLVLTNNDQCRIDHSGRLAAAPVLAHSPHQTKPVRHGSPSSGRKRL